MYASTNPFIIAGADQTMAAIRDGEAAAPEANDRLFGDALLEDTIANAMHYATSRATLDNVMDVAILVKGYGPFSHPLSEGQFPITGPCDRCTLSASRVKMATGSVRCSAGATVIELHVCFDCYTDLNDRYPNLAWTTHAVDPNPLPVW
ncbi:hypothetical protein [Agromyces sp. GXS1127]|uniref:hypothetical protein n=1 Tax=Agromyces sp. GXS1127 TaxID=3424181 RepID=UPI003D313198